MLQIFVDSKDILDKLDYIQYASSNVGLMSFLEGMPEQALKERISQRFHSQGDEASGGWLPLKETTQAIRMSKGFQPDKPINVRTGAMREWLLSAPGQVNPTGIGAELRYPGVEPPGTMKFAYGTAQMGSAVHKTPARPVNAVSHVDLGIVLALLGGFVIAGTKMA